MNTEYRAQHGHISLDSCFICAPLIMDYKVDFIIQIAIAESFLKNHVYRMFECNGELNIQRHTAIHRKTLHKN